MRRLFAVFFLFLVLAGRPLFAENGGSDISARLTRLINKMDEFENKQQEILAQQDKILEEIDSLKIQARR